MHLVLAKIWHNGKKKMTHKLVGKSYTFEDGASIKVIQVKERDDHVEMVTYETRSGPGIPRKLVMNMGEFLDNFGHLFAEDV